VVRQKERLGSGFWLAAGVCCQWEDRGPAQKAERLPYYLAMSIQICVTTETSRLVQ
jgi:hypothetical protein